LDRSGQGRKTSAEMIEIYRRWVQDFPIVSIEDGLGENDWDGFRDLTSVLGDGIQIVGADICVTNTTFIERGIAEETASAALIKPNQNRRGLGNDCRGGPLPVGRMDLCRVLSIWRNGGCLHRRLRGRNGRQSDQRGQPLPRRTGREIQSAATDRTGAWQYCGV
jgi:Enolase, C-terminal TIM barrel domain